ncbi:hypothetical protein [Neisseria sp. Ec49-e6-T10]|uniref:hypothetical protein n=1 Tax=Neisseria sp. Ec49-e6-T10 TaxID=3140744 RepID=UPI003EBBF027
MSLETLYKIIILLLKRNKKNYWLGETKRQYRILVTDINIKNKQKALDELHEIFHPKGLMDDIIYGRFKVEWSGYRWHKLIDTFFSKAEKILVTFKA